jgi:hypothetical protein
MRVAARGKGGGWGVGWSVSQAFPTAEVIENGLNII